jgi:hypothetical protein
MAAKSAVVRKARTSLWSTMSRIWAGADCDKRHYHCLALDAEGDTLLSRRVANDDPELLELIRDVLEIADSDRATWATDMTGGEPALLASHNRISGIAVNRATDSYRGMGKTDARDAQVIADRHGCAGTCNRSDQFVEGRFRAHELADVITSMPGIGTTLGFRAPRCDRRQSRRPPRRRPAGGLRRGSSRPCGCWRKPVSAMHWQCPSRSRSSRPRGAGVSTMS